MITTTPVFQLGTSGASLSSPAENEPDYLVVVIIFATAKVEHIAQAAAGANVSCELMHVKSVTCTGTGTLV